MAASKQFLTEPQHLMWKLALDKYDDILNEKANKKSKPSSVKELIELDKWQQLEKSYTEVAGNMVANESIAVAAAHSESNKDAASSERVTGDILNNNIPGNSSETGGGDNQEHEDSEGNADAPANQLLSQACTNHVKETKDSSVTPVEPLSETSTDHGSNVAKVDTPCLDKTPCADTTSSIIEEPKVMEVDPNLPEGWSRLVRQRKSGATSGQYDVYIIAPDKTRLRSRPEVANYINRHGLPIDPNNIDFTTFGQHVQIPKKGRKNRQTTETEQRDKTPKSNGVRKRPVKDKPEKMLLIVKMNFKKGRKRKQMASCDKEKASPARKRSRVESTRDGSEGEPDNEMISQDETLTNESAERRKVYKEIEEEAKLISELTAKKVESEQQEVVVQSENSSETTDDPKCFEEEDSSDFLLFSPIHPACIALN